MHVIAPDRGIKLQPEDHIRHTGVYDLREQCDFECRNYGNNFRVLQAVQSALVLRRDRSSSQHPVDSRMHSLY